MRHLFWTCDECGEKLTEAECVSGSHPGDVGPKFSQWLAIAPSFGNGGAARACLSVCLCKQCFTRCTLALPNVWERHKGKT